MKHHVCLIIVVLMLIMHTTGKKIHSTCRQIGYLNTLSNTLSNSQTLIFFFLLKTFLFLFLDFIPQGDYHFEIYGCIK